MKYDMKRPCAECPFLRGTPLNKTLPKERIQGFAQGEFPCHKTAELTEEGYEGTAESQHCAGALIALEKVRAPHQMMRICERLGFYDPSQLDMTSDVIDGAVLRGTVLRGKRRASR